MKRSLKKILVTLLLFFPTISSFAMEAEDIQKNFFKAIKEGDFDTVEKIAAANRNIINIRNIEESKTPLILAISEGHSKIAEFLLNAEGINIELPDYFGNPPLHCAAFFGRTEIMKLLLNMGANKDLQTHESGGDAPLHRAATGIENRIKTTKLLINADANIDLQNSFGETPLYCAVRTIDQKTAKILIEANANINVQDKSGKTPLHCSVLDGHTEMVRLLLDAGANKTLQTNHGYTALDLAKNGAASNLPNKSSYIEIIELLS